MQCKESLVPACGGACRFSVSPIVNTKAYHDAFEEMPVSRSAAQAAYEQAGRILRATNGTEFEHMAAVNARTGKLVADNLGRAPMRARTGFRDDEIAKVKACREGVVLIHNHPASKPPSYQDVHTAALYSAIVASIVLGHDGSVWWGSVSDAELADKLVAHYNELKDDLGDYAEVKALKILLEENKTSKKLDWRGLR